MQARSQTPSASQLGTTTSTSHKGENLFKGQRLFLVSVRLRRQWQKTSNHDFEILTCSDTTDVRSRHSTTQSQGTSQKCQTPFPGSQFHFFSPQISLIPQGTIPGSTPEMCVTEIWTYPECGCHYDHSVLCRSYRKDHYPWFVPNVQYPLDMWLEEAGVDAETAYKQLKRRARPIDPHDCPQHESVHKSFLNQICDDCLLAEVDAEPLTLDNAQTAQRDTVAGPDNAEGLIWDSEVKVEIQDQKSEGHKSEIPPEAVDAINDSSEGDQTILEKHIEMKVEIDSYSVSADEFSSPVFHLSHNGRSSRSSSIATSPLSARLVEKPRSGSVVDWNKRHGRTFDDTIASDFDDADDESDDDTERYHQNSSCAVRGRSLTRRSINCPAERESGSDDALLQVGDKPSHNGFLRFKNFKSFSTTFRTGSKPNEEDRTIGSDSLVEMTSESTPTRSKSRNPFRSLRTRKSSPLVADPADTKPILHDDLLNSTIEESKIVSEADEPSPIPPRKSSLKNWGLFMIQDFKRSKRAARSRSRSRTRSRAPSPTGSRSRQHMEYREAKESSSPEIHSHPERAFETGWAISSVEVENAPEIKVEETSPSTSMLPSIPQSPTMSIRRTIINGGLDLDFGFDSEAKTVPQSPTSLEENVAEPDNLELPTANNDAAVSNISGDASVPSPGIVEAKAMVLIRPSQPPRSSSLRSPEAAVDEADPGLEEDVSAPIVVPGSN